MPMFPSEKDPITTHDWMPSYPRKSVEYQKAAEKVESTYKKYLKICDEIEECDDLVSDKGQILYAKAINKLREFECAEKIKEMLYEKEMK